MPTLRLSGVEILLPARHRTVPRTGKSGQTHPLLAHCTASAFNILGNRGAPRSSTHKNSQDQYPLLHDTDHSVAESVKSTHPDEALTIWKRVAEWEIARVKPASYKAAAPYLKKIRALYLKQKRTDQWNTYITALRRQHRAKRRLIDILDTL
jgi:hypothetical protein